MTECCGVHWDVGDTIAKTRFKQWGFVGISNFRKIEASINGNKARDKARELAKAGFPNVRYFYRGVFDANWTADDSALYRFSYAEYSGERTSDDVMAADYSEVI